MPFTGSHPAAVLPFARSSLPLSALFIGSIVPDLPLYVPTPYSARLSHQLLGVVTVDILAGLVMYTVWSAVLRPLVTAYVPPAVGWRIAAPQPAKPWWMVVAVSLGALTHVVWDAFTHRGSWGIRMIPALDEQIGDLPAYEWAQYASGLLGVVVMCWWMVHRWRIATEGADPDRPETGRLVPSRPLAAAVISLGAIAGTAIGFRHGLGQPDPVRSAFFYAATRGIDVGVFAALGIGVIHRLAVRRRAAGCAKRSKRDASRNANSGDDQVMPDGRR